MTSLFISPGDRAFSLLLAMRNSLHKGVTQTAHAKLTQHMICTTLFMEAMQALQFFSTFAIPLMDLCPLFLLADLYSRLCCHMLTYTADTTLWFQEPWFMDAMQYSKILY